MESTRSGQTSSAATFHLKHHKGTAIFSLQRLCLLINAHDMTIHLCAEHLINISTLSIQASVSTVLDKETKATLTIDGYTLTLTHEGEAASVRLPISVSPNKPSHASMILPPSNPTKEVNFRVQLEQRPGVAAGPLSQSASSGTAGNGNIVPWTATDLTREAEISCHSCSTVLVPRGAVREWKDLPSEGWAEMMEYWHCHKPVDHHDNDGSSAADAHAGSRKGYAAGSRLAVQSAVGLVGIADFLLSPEDCRNIATSEPTSRTASTSSSFSSSSSLLHCKTCFVPLGQTDPSSSNANKLRKRNLAISLSATHPATAFEPSQWLSSQLLAASESQGVRKFVIHYTCPVSAHAQQQTSPAISESTTTAHPLLSDKKAKAGKMRLWLFTPDLTISTSALQPPDPVRVAKVLWREEELPHPSSNSDSIDDQPLGGEKEQVRAQLERNGDKLNAQTLSEGELELSAEEVDVLRRELAASANWLPEKGRTFGGGGGGVMDSTANSDGDGEKVARNGLAPDEWRVGLLRRFREEDVHSGPTAF